MDEPKYVKGAKATFTVKIGIDGMEDVEEAKERFTNAMNEGSDSKDAFYYTGSEWIYLDDNLEQKAEYLDRLVDFIIRDYLRTCDEADRKPSKGYIRSSDFGRHATTVFQFASNYVNDTIMHIGGEEIPAREETE